jgi:Lecithin retinol acyltransferase
MRAPPAFVGARRLRTSRLSNIQSPDSPRAHASARTGRSRDVSTLGTICLFRPQQHPQGVPHHARRSNRREGDIWRARWSDALLATEEKPPLGSHLVSQRRGFRHHGIYVGDGLVVHYESAVRRLRRGPVEEVPLARFTLGRQTWIRVHATSRFCGAEVVRRARSRLGEDRYRLLSNNCEHFCEWCLQGEHRSYQVERLLGLPRRLVRVCGRTVAALRPDGGGFFDRSIRVLRALPPRRQYVSLGR